MSNVGALLGLDTPAVTALIASELADSPTLVNPALGTPSSGDLQNCTGPLAGETATAAVAGTTLTLTPPSTLTDGIYDVDLRIKSANSSAVFRFYINGDTVAANYEYGVVVSLAGTVAGEETTNSPGYGGDSGRWIVAKLRMYVTGGRLEWFTVGMRSYAATNTGRVIVGAAAHASATTVASMQVTASIANAIDAGSKISYQRVA